eukprot:1613321-Amphidinium_carterae.1
MRFARKRVSSQVFPCQRAVSVSKGLVTEEYPSDRYVPFVGTGLGLCEKVDTSTFQNAGSGDSGHAYSPNRNVT